MDEILIQRAKKGPKMKIAQQRHRFPYQKLPGPLEPGPEPSIFQKSVSCARWGVSEATHNEIH